jgi:hypothetical protein
VLVELFEAILDVSQLNITCLLFLSFILHGDEVLGGSLEFLSCAGDFLAYGLERIPN